MVRAIDRVIVAKLETRSSIESTTLEYKIDTGSSGNLMLANIFKILFPKTVIVEQARYKNKRAI